MTNINWSGSDVVKFWLGEWDFGLSLDELKQGCGFYAQEFTDFDEHRGSIYEFGTTTHTPQKFWHEIVKGAAVH